MPFTIHCLCRRPDRSRVPGPPPTGQLGCAHLVLGGCLALASPVQAQWLKAPVFRFEPGIITVNAVSAPLPSGSSTGLNLRFVTQVPTAVQWLSLLVGTSLAPLGLSNGLRASNDPTFFYGLQARVLPRRRTAGWLEFSVPVLGAYHLDETGDSERLYLNDLMLQGAVTAPIGNKLLADMGRVWSRLTVYLIAEQNLTPGRILGTNEIDRFRPTFFYGASIPVGRSLESAEETSVQR